MAEVQLRILVRNLAAETFLVPHLAAVKCLGPNLAAGAGFCLMCTAYSPDRQGCGYCTAWSTLLDLDTQEGWQKLHL